MKRCPRDESQDDEINTDLQIWKRGSQSQRLKHSETLRASASYDYSEKML